MKFHLVSKFPYNRHTNRRTRNRMKNRAKSLRKGGIQNHVFRKGSWKPVIKR